MNRYIKWKSHPNIAVNGYAAEVMVFPSGERNVRLRRLRTDDGVETVDIVAVLDSSDDILDLLMYANALKKMNLNVRQLLISFVPYARQDRVCNTGEALSIEVMASLINTVEAERVVIRDPHSDVTPALIKNVQVQEQHELVPNIAGDIVYVCPDAGAEKKISKLTKSYVMCGKRRNLRTGEIVATEIYSKLSDFPDHVPFMIVDDICDGGRTFVEIAKVLKATGKPSEIHLYVTHGLFTKGFEVFEGLIDYVWWWDSSGCQMKRIGET